MTDNKIVKDTAREPEREALGPMRSGIRAAAKKAVAKVAKKPPGQKKTAQKAAKKAAATAGKTTATTGRSAKKGDKSASAGAAASASRAAAGKAPTAKTSAGKTSTGKTATGKASTGKTSTGKASTAEARAAPARAAAVGSGRTRASESAGNTANASAAPAATVSHEAGPSIEAHRPPAPVHPGAALDSISTQEQSGGLGSLLALWGPLVIVGFLVLVFRGGDDAESTVATGAGTSDRTSADMAPETALTAESSGAVQGTAGASNQAVADTAPAMALTAGSSGAAQGAAGASNQAAGMAPTAAPTSGPPGPQGTGEAFDSGFAMRTSMAGQPAFAGRESGAGAPLVAPGGIYPSPPGPYRDPRYSSLSTGGRWSADGAGEWAGEWRWSAESRAGTRQEDGDAPVQWVRCAAPYYWCPAPSTPTW